MSVSDRAYMHDVVAAEAVDAERAAFIKKTYGHLAGAILAFAGIEAVLLQTPFALASAEWAFSGWNWLIVLGAFMLVSWIAESWARSSTSLGMQYAGLGLFVVAEAAIFLPLLGVAEAYGGEDVIPMAAGATVLVVAALTMVVFSTKADFSFLRPALGLLCLGAFGYLVGSMFFGFSIGNTFTWIMVVVAGGCVLYNTSNVLHHYRTTQHVAAALALFSSVAILFWYVLRIFMSRD